MVLQLVCGCRDCYHHRPDILRLRWLRAVADKRVVETAVPLRDRFSPRRAAAGSHCAAIQDSTYR